MTRVDRSFGVGIIGCGLIGHKRAHALGEYGRLVACADIDVNRADQLAKGSGARVFSDWQELVKLPEVDIVIISTSNDWLTPIGLYSLEHNKHVLVEKPAARSLTEIVSFREKALSSSQCVKVGFNLRYHPALMKAREIVDSRIMGELMFIRGRYGHGGRIGYDKEWRAKPEISGGGELIDQGVHMIDLCRWFLGDFVSINGQTATYFWDMPVDDNAFLCLSTQKNQIAWIQVSCTEWKNMFSLEIYGKTGKIQIDGLGGSYGIEKLAYYQMLPQMGPPQTTVWEYPGEDNSWNLEFRAFTEAIHAKSPLNGDINDAYEALKIVDKIYRG
ncbi:MAG: Gfo/Idh/MocA family oxidoreductase [Candidatus Omnitrophica bacterium]|nr:Gfo/Idh/MocA family oxidoreductase [Candidatus Omnitrophota bacterium]